MYSKTHTGSTIFFFSIITVFLLSFGLTDDAFAEVEVNDRKIIDATTTVTSDSSTLGLLADDRFGYQIEPIGDLDGDGVIDLAVSSYRDSNPDQHDDEGSVIVMFMNSDGTVKSTNKILHDNTSDGLGTSCIDSSANVDPDVSGFEAISYLGNLINGNPTIALGAPWDNYANTVNTSIHNSGAVYLLELETTGKVKSCVRIVDNDGSLFNPSSPRTTGDGAQFGFSLASTDLDGDGTLELLTVIQNTSIHDDLWAFYLDSTGAITAATEYTSSNLGINSYVDSMSSVNGGNKIAIGKESTGVYIVNFDGNTGVLSTVNLISSSSVGSSSSGFGSGVEPIGDMDGDGVIDLMAGALFTDDNGDGGGNDEGAAYILFMNSDDTLKRYQKISNTSEKDRTGSTFLQTDDFFGNDMAFWMNSNGQTVVAIGAHDADTGASAAGELYLFYLNYVSTTGSNSNGCSDCIDPTFYYSKHNLIVENAFTYNDYSTDVTDRFTEIDLIETKINQQNKLILKVYDNGGTDNIKWVDVGFGIPEFSTIFDDSEATIEIKLKNNKVVHEDLKISDPLNLIDFGVISSKVVNCGYLDKGCLQVTIPHSFRDGFVNTNLIIRASDYEPNTKYHIISEAIHIQGDTINPLPTDKLFIKKYLGSPDSEWVIITLIDRSNNIWTSEDGLEFKSTSGGGYKRITPLGPIPNLE